jgi:hypothetical protein
MELKPIAIALACAALVMSASACTYSTSDRAPATRGAATAASGDPSSTASESVEQPLQCTDVTGASITGEITTDDPTQRGHFFLHMGPPPAAPPTQDPNPTCDEPLPMPEVIDEDRQLHYDAYEFKNWASSETCIAVRRGGAGFPEVVAYIGAFDPQNIRTNYAADTAAIEANFSFKVPALTPFTIVLSGMGSYTLSVTGCGKPSGASGAEDAGASSGGASDAGSGGKTW